MDQATHNKIVSFIWGIADDVLRDLFKRGLQIDSHLYGQEINPETSAVCKADVLLKGECAEGVDGADHFVGGAAPSKAGEYADRLGFCTCATLEDIPKHGHVLTPGRNVGAEAAEDDGEPLEGKMKRRTATLREQQTGVAKLDAAIAATSSRIQAERLRVLSTNAALTPSNRTLAADTQKREFPECR